MCGTLYWKVCALLLIRRWSSQNSCFQREGTWVEQTMWGHLKYHLYFNMSLKMWNGNHFGRNTIFTTTLLPWKTLKSYVLPLQWKRQANAKSSAKIAPKQSENYKNNITSLSSGKKKSPNFSNSEKCCLIWQRNWKCELLLIDIEIGRASSRCEKLTAIFCESNIITYLRYGSRYVEKLRKLSLEHPEVYQEFMEGSFVVKNNRWCSNAVLTGLKLEWTVQRSKKYISEIIGQTRKESFVIE